MKKTKLDVPLLLEQIEMAGTKKDKEDLCLQNGITLPTFYRWRAEQAKQVPHCPQCRQLAVENSRLRNIIVDLLLDKKPLREVLLKEFKTERPVRGAPVSDRRIHAWNRQRRSMNLERGGDFRQHPERQSQAQE